MNWSIATRIADRQNRCGRVTGFIVGAALAFQLGVGFVPIRKKGKLPAETIGHDYDLEYGSDRIEMHVDAIAQGERILLVDDLIATGGTAEPP